MIKKSLPRRCVFMKYPCQLCQNAFERHEIAIKIASPLFSIFRCFWVTAKGKTYLFSPNVIYLHEGKAGLRSESKSSWLLRYLHCLTKLLSSSYMLLKHFMLFHQYLYRNKLKIFHFILLKAGWDLSRERIFIRALMHIIFLPPSHWKFP